MKGEIVTDEILKEAAKQAQETYMKIITENMTQEREAQILQRAVDTYGVEHQTDKAIEELSELTKALLKFRYEPTETRRNELLYEMADVGIMLSQLALMYGDFNDQEIEKLDRLERRLDRGVRHWV